MTLSTFTSTIEKILEEEVKKLLPGYWDEDQLTIGFLIALTKQLSNNTIDDFRGGAKVFINAFKQSGKLTETKYGDIAIILNITFPDGERIEGIAYIEAKKRKVGGVTFDAVKETQLKTINENAPRARLLLYDYEPITGFIASYFEEEMYRINYNRTLRLMPTTHSVVIPLNLALHIKHYDTKLYKFGLPFSHQLTFRYMYGQDLEFNEAAIKASKGFAERQNLSKYIMTITIGPEGIKNEKENLVNMDYYERLQ
jgi:hypothetical protein